MLHSVNPLHNASSVTAGESIQIERVWKSALRIILSDKYHSYNYALEYLELEALNSRRDRLCLKFAEKCLESKKFSNWFKSELKETITRQRYPKFCPVYSRTKRYELSPISYMTKLLNKSKKSQWIFCMAYQTLWQWLIGAAEGEAEDTFWAEFSMLPYH